MKPIFPALFVAVFVFVAGVLHTYNVSDQYRAEGMIQLVTKAPKYQVYFEMLVEQRDMEEEDIEEVDTEPLEILVQTELMVLKSGMLVRTVAAQLDDDERWRLMAAYSGDSFLSGPVSVEEVLHGGREVRQKGRSAMAAVSFRHPDPEIAARIANLLMEEYINFGIRAKIDAYMRMVEDLRLRLDHADGLIEASTLEYEQLAQERGVGEDAFDARMEIARRDLEIEIAERERIRHAWREGMTRIPLITTHARIVDHATPPLRPVSPNIPLRLGVYLLAAVAAGWMVSRLTRRRNG